MDDSPHLMIEAGPDKGRALHVPPAGLRLGRASSNDVALADPLLSRHHCRLEFRSDGSLWITDLASANQTLVNGKPVQEARLRTGDRVLIGATQLAVLKDEAPGAPPPAGAGTGADAETPVVDLGFAEPAGEPPPAASLRPLLWAAGAAAVLLLGAALIMRLPARHETGAGAPPPEEPWPLEIHYEKIEADHNSIFRYEMTLTPELTLAVCIDDLAENRHVRRETTVATNRVRELAREFESGGFLALGDSYEGIPRENRLASWEITVILGKRAKRCRVANRLEPEPFRTLRERLETFGKNELGIWAIQFSRDKLVALAEEALTRARNKFDERGIAYGNLAEAIRRYKEAEFYLETVDPKPDFYAEIVSGLAQATEELERRYEEQRFLADRAINTRDWRQAARELRILRELIPDRDDPRHVEATRKLLDVESRLKQQERQ